MNKNFEIKGNHATIFLTNENETYFGCLSGYFSLLQFINKFGEFALLFSPSVLSNKSKNADSISFDTCKSFLEKMIEKSTKVRFLTKIHKKWVIHDGFWIITRTELSNNSLSINLIRL